MKTKHIIYLLGFFFFGLTSCKDNEKEEVELEDPAAMEETFEERVDEMRETNETVDALEARPELSTFATNLNSWNVEDRLGKLGQNYIIFAPNNMAYSKVYKEQGKDILAVNPEEKISYLIVKMDLTPDQLKQKIKDANGKMSLPTLNGKILEASLRGDKIMLKGATGETATVVDNFTVKNGTVYVIDSVLLPDGVGTKVEINTDQ